MTMTIISMAINTAALILWALVLWRTHRMVHAQIEENKKWQIIAMDNKRAVDALIDGRDALLLAIANEFPMKIEIDPERIRSNAYQSAVDAIVKNAYQSATDMESNANDA